MAGTFQSIIESRIDLSEYLFHFTNGAKAKQTLRQILADGKLKDVNSKGFICLTEAPLTSLVPMFEIFAKFPKPMYAPYGVAVLRNELFKQGARPVIYGDSSEKALLDASIQWRFLELNPGNYDFSWLREWRIQASEVILNPAFAFAITATKQEEVDLAFDMNVEIDGCVSDGEFHPIYEVHHKREWKSISIEEIKAALMSSDLSVKTLIGTQAPGIDALRSW